MFGAYLIETLFKFIFYGAVLKPDKDEAVFVEPLPT